MPILGSTFNLTFSRIRVFAVILSAALTSVGCANLGIPVIDIDLEVQVQRRAISGLQLASNPAQFSREPAFPKSPAKFPAVVYGGELFAARFVIEPNSIGIAVRSQQSGQICFRFDEATLKSNFLPQASPLNVMWVQVAGKPIFSDKPTYGAAYQPSKQCFNQEFTRYAFGPDLTALFPNGTMFNVKLTESGNTIATNGRGNWLRISVPVEYDGKKEEVDILLTAKNSAMRISNFLR
jgi:hypothetical protein